MRKNSCSPDKCLINVCFLKESRVLQITLIRHVDTQSVIVAWSSLESQIARNLLVTPPQKVKSWSLFEVAEYLIVFTYIKNNVSTLSVLELLLTPPVISLDILFALKIKLNMTLLRWPRLQTKSKQTSEGLSQSPETTLKFLKEWEQRWPITLQQNPNPAGQNPNP